MGWTDLPREARDRVTVVTREAIEVPRGWITGAAVLCVVLVLYVAQSQVPRNVVHLPGQESAKPVAVALAPQGWAFFTKSARSLEFEPFRLTPAGWVSASLGRHSEHGFNRVSRSQGIETALLLHEAGKITPTPCTAGSPQDCLAKARNASHVTNRTPDPTLCGRIAVVEQRPTPFAWRDLLPARTPKSAYLLDVTC
ncbi:SdpA family antimicrobial peptide system protein [Streptomyces sp. NPDC051840]|uniref:SdpA family antimicrobial peptide system protein n=1 Tax=unclassified Streptomyces TaxID=2593676 RepID=UPI00343CB59E